ncbi:MAG: MFS transporter, partial [Halioglobus sp.]
LLWPQMLIVVSAYVGYKGVDNYVLYAVQGYGMNEVDAAGISTTSAWLRPVAAIAAGYLADRFLASRIVTLSFLVLCVGYSFFALLDPSPNLVWVLIANIAITSIAVYALHAIYFALLAESQIPLGVTGTAIGVISVVGFTPDIFFAPAMGMLLDNNTLVQGHQWVFTLMGAFAVLGLLSSFLFMRWSSAASSKPGEAL